MFHNPPSSTRSQLNYRLPGMVSSAVVIINSSGVISCGSQGDSVSREAPSSPTAGFSGGGATAFPAQAAGKDLRGEHLSDFENKVRAFCSL